MLSREKGVLYSEQITIFIVARAAQGDPSGKGYVTVLSHSSRSASF
jgi:hypothetical protein